jgi:transcriptional regulator with XRE-family HTH domain
MSYREEMILGLEKLRRDAGLTQAELASRAKLARSTVTSIELGHRPSDTTLERLASVLEEALGRGIGPTALIDPDLLVDPELAPLTFRVGQLLQWLPFDHPQDKVWVALTPEGMHSSDYLREKWHYIVSSLTFDDTPHFSAGLSHGLFGSQMRYILLFLKSTPETIDALSTCFATQENPVIARQWCDDLLTSAWRIWTATQSGPPS